MRANLLLKNVKEALFPTDFTCDVCGAETFGERLCPDCKKRVAFNDGATCPVCGRRTGNPEICMECKDKPPMFKKAVSPLVYSDASIILISKFKNGFAYLGEFFGDLMVGKLIGFPKIDVIVCVPLTKFSLFRRGFNPSELLAKNISLKTRTPLLKGAIKRIRRGKPQKGLSMKEREANVNGAFKVVKRKEIKGRSVLLIDDVMTTGATADEISKILRAAGAKYVYVACAASVEYKTATKKAEKIDGEKSKNCVN